MGTRCLFLCYLVGNLSFIPLSRYTDIGTSKMTDVYEGSLIRMFRRLEELLRQMAQASKVMGSEELEKKFEEALTKVKRGQYRTLRIPWGKANEFSRHRCRRVPLPLVAPLLLSVLCKSYIICNINIPGESWTLMHLSGCFHFLVASDRT